VKTGCRPNIYHRYEINCRVHIIPELGHRQISKLSAPEIQQFLADKQDPEKRRQRKERPLAPRTVKQMFAVLRNALNVALEWRLIPYNPCQGVRPPKVPKTRYRTVIGEEVLILLERVQGHSLECLITLALTTGLREGELLGLRWQDVDLVRGLVMVRQQAQRVPYQGWYFPEPKSDTSSRLVLLTDPGVAALLRQETRVELMRDVAGDRWEDHNLVHPNRLGRPIEKGNLIRRWKRFLGANSFEDMTIHELRHSTATVLFSLGVPLPVIQEILGHSGISVTSDIYRGYVAPLHEDAMAKLNAFLTRRPAVPPCELSSRVSSKLLRAPSGA
jgi:integrase